MNKPIQLKLKKKTSMGRGIEVGVGGMSLWLDDEIERGAMVTLGFILPRAAKRIIAMAEVMWCKPASSNRRKARVGVKFIALQRDERALIRAFVTKRARHYRDLHIMLAMNEWKMEKLKELTKAAGLTSYRDIKELKTKIQKAMAGFRG